METPLVTATDREADGYVAGACNIGAEEIARRRRGAVIGLAAAGALAVTLLAVGAPRPSRLLVALPLAGGTVGWLQARERFCVAFASRGIYNFDQLGSVTPVLDAAARRQDRRRAAGMIGRSALVGLAGAGLLLLLPG